MNGRAAALLILVGLILFGILTAAPVLFNYLGLALYVALMRECSKHVVPWRRARKALFLDRVPRTANPAPPPESGPSSEVKPLVREIGTGEGYLIYPNQRATESVHGE